MTSTTAPSSAPTVPSKSLHVGLWIAQGLLALAFTASGFLKLTTPLAQLSTMMSWVTAAGEPMVRFIGATEVLGAIGLILPSLFKVAPKLTPAAAAGLVTVMVLAAGTHASYGEYNRIAVNLVLGGLAGFVAWGRLLKAPIAPR